MPGQRRQNCFDCGRVEMPPVWEITNLNTADDEDDDDDGLNGVDQGSERRWS